ncbi:VirB4 family type IV secretion/conjugal transfer ATPase [Burkholderia vietnamiensis]|uniref:VirB4 family type IV secretion/conjugal transfer ATPase n=1 Tax=Burkholderia vietnamiensis TaxID=60552 RepID=UPI001594A7CC|nr:conjugal transfer protein TrbE [Burkholderia vietnamiensis]MCA8270391.1 transporter [Burkholderia vietnamiensis]
MLKLREYRNRLKGFADLLTYACMVDQHTILLKTGAFMTSFYFRGQDLQSSTHEEMAAIAAQVNAGLMKMGTGWMLHVDAVKVPATNYPARNRNHFPDNVTALIDEERRMQYQTEGLHFDTVYAMTFTYTVPPEIQQRVAAWFIEDEERAKGIDYSAVFERFKSYVDEIVRTLSSQIHVRQMDGEELLTYLHSCITGLNHRVRVPAIPMYLDAVLSSKDYFGGLKPRMGKRHIRALTITGYPAETIPAILDRLNTLQFEYRWNTRFIALDPNDAKRIITKYRRNWWQKRHGLAGIVKSAFGGAGETWGNTDAVSKANDADAAINDIEEGLVRYGLYTATVVVSDENSARVDEHAKAIQDLLEEFGFASQIETINATESFLGTLPGEGFANVKRVPIHTLNLSDLLPLTSVWTGRDTHPCPFYPKNSPALMYAATTGATPIRVNFHVGDVGHTGIFGPIGAGKTTLLNLAVAQHFRFPEAEAIIFDYKYGAYVQTKAAGGQHYDIAGERNAPQFCPFGELESPQDRAWAKEYIALLYALHMGEDNKLTPMQTGHIHKGVEGLYNTTKNMADPAARSAARTMTHMRAQIQDQQIKDVLDYYTVSGQAGLLDAKADTMRDGRLVVFETMNLMEMGEKAVIPVLEYLFRCVAKKLRGQPLMIVLDEAWLMLAHWFFRDRLIAWLRLVRSFNGHVVFATQSLAEAVNSSIADIVFSSLATKVLLPNPEALTDTIKPLYQKIGLNERQIENLAHATKKRDYYLMSAEGRRMIDLGLGKVALAFVGASGIEAVKRVDELEAQHGGEWVEHWMREQAVPEDWIAYWNNMAKRDQHEEAIA